VLAVSYFVGGVAMVAMSKDRFRSISQGQHYVDDFSAGFITFIGVLKLFAVAGLTLPAAFDVAPDLVPLAALGLMLLMTGASTTRIIRKEWRYLLIDLMFWVLAGFVAWGRYVVEPLGG